MQFCKIRLCLIKEKTRSNKYYIKCHGAFCSISRQKQCNWSHDWKSKTFTVVKGWNFKNVTFYFYPWCVQSELSLVRHGHASKVRTVMKSWDPEGLKCDIFRISPFIWSLLTVWFYISHLSDINKFLWMVRIGGSTPEGAHIKEWDYYTPSGEFRWYFVAKILLDDFEQGCIFCP